MGSLSEETYTTIIRACQQAITVTAHNAFEVTTVDIEQEP